MRDVHAACWSVLISNHSSKTAASIFKPHGLVSQVKTESTLPSLRQSSTSVLSLWGHGELAKVVVAVKGEMDAPRPHALFKPYWTDAQRYVVHVAGAVVAGCCETLKVRGAQLSQGYVRRVPLLNGSLRIEEHGHEHVEHGRPCCSEHASGLESGRSSCNPKRASVELPPYGARARGELSAKKVQAWCTNAELLKRERMSLLPRRARRPQESNHPKSNRTRRMPFRTPGSRCARCSGAALSASTGLVSMIERDHAAAVVGFWSDALGSDAPFVFAMWTVTVQLGWCAIGVVRWFMLVGELCRVMHAHGSSVECGSCAHAAQRRFCCHCRLPRHGVCWWCGFALGTCALALAQYGHGMCWWCGPALGACALALAQYAGARVATSQHWHTRVLYGGERDEVLQYMPPYARQRADGTAPLRQPTGGYDRFLNGLQTLPLDQVRQALCTVSMPHWRAGYVRICTQDAETAQRHEITQWYNLWRGTSRLLPTREEYMAQGGERRRQIRRPYGTNGTVQRRMPTEGYNAFFDGLQTRPLDETRRALCAVEMPGWCATYDQIRTHQPAVAQQHAIARFYNLWYGLSRTLPTEEQYQRARNERRLFTGERAADANGVMHETVNEEAAAGGTDERVDETGGEANLIDDPMWDDMERVLPAVHEGNDEFLDEFVDPVTYVDDDLPGVPAGDVNMGAQQRDDATTAHTHATQARTGTAGANPDTVLETPVDGAAVDDCRHSVYAVPFAMAGEPYVGSRWATYDGASIVPVNQPQGSTISWLLCPLMADALGLQHLYPAHVVPRPDLTSSWHFVNGPFRASWGELVQLMASAMERWATTRLGGHSLRRFMVARMDMQNHWPGRTQEELVHGMDALPPAQAIEWLTLLSGCAESLRAQAVEVRRARVPNERPRATGVRRVVDVARRRARLRHGTYAMVEWAQLPAEAKCHECDQTFAETSLAALGCAVCARKCHIHCARVAWLPTDPWHCRICRHVDTYELTGAEPPGAEPTDPVQTLAGAADDGGTERVPAWLTVSGHVGYVNSTASTVQVALVLAIHADDSDEVYVTIDRVESGRCRCNGFKHAQLL
jgi:hypothetical protein